MQCMHRLKTKRYSLPKMYVTCNQNWHNPDLAAEQTIMTRKQKRKKETLSGQTRPTAFWRAHREQWVLVFLRLF